MSKLILIDLSIACDTNDHNNMPGCLPFSHVRLIEWLIVCLVTEGTFTCILYIFTTLYIPASYACLQNYCFNFGIS